MPRSVLMPAPFDRVRSAWERHWFLPRSNRRLVALRLVLGVTMIAEWAQVFPWLQDLYGPYGFLEAGLMNAISGWSLPGFATAIEAQGVSYATLLWIVASLRWIFLVTFTIGLFPRVSAAVLWLMQAFIMSSGSLSSYGVDRYFFVLLFLVMWMPIQNQEREDDRVGLSIRTLQWAVLITYLNAGAAKMMGTEWWNGDAIWRVLHLPEFTHASFLWMADWPWVPKLLAWGTLLLETLYPIGVWIPLVGPLWVLGIISLHVGIAALMGLVTFGVTLALINAVLFLPPPRRFSRASKRRDP